MSQPNPPSGDYFMGLLQDLKNRLANLETQQNHIVADATGTPVVQVGVFPGTPITYGVKTLDNAGLLRVAMGLLQSGDYGLAVSDVNGYTTEILPVYQGAVTTGQGTTSTTYADLATAGPTVNAIIGASGQALITVNSYIGIPGATSGTQSGGFVGVSIDGAAPTGLLDLILYFANTVVGASAVGQASACSGTCVLTGLSPGAHSFEMVYKMAGPGTATFANRYLQVRPL